ncbi:TPA: hypothetical protein ACXZLP_004162 [Salmonella enterica]
MSFLKKTSVFVCLFLFSGFCDSAETWQCPDIRVTQFSVDSIHSSASTTGIVGAATGNITYNWKNNIASYTGAWWEWIGFRFDGLVPDLSVPGGIAGEWFRVNDYLSVRGTYVSHSKKYTIPEVSFWMAGSGANTGSGTGQRYPLTLEFYIKKLPVDGVLSIPPINLSYGIYFTPNSTMPSIDETLSCPSRVGATVATGSTINVTAICTIMPKDLSVDFGAVTFNSVRQGKNKRTRKLSITCTSPVNLYASIRSSHGDELVNKTVSFPTNLSGINIKVSVPDATQTVDGHIVLLGNNQTTGEAVLEFTPEVDDSVLNPDATGMLSASGVIVLLRD